MTKTELYNVLSAGLEVILSDNKLSNKASEALKDMIDTHVKPRTGIKHPPLENGDLYCRLMDAYFAPEKMVMSKGKSKGYSKEGISIWNKANSTIKRMSVDYTDIEDSTSKEATGLKDRIINLKLLIKTPSAFKDSSLLAALV